MALQQQGRIIVIILVLLVAVVTVTSVPISPSISVSFSVKTVAPTYYSNPSTVQLSLLSVSYQKVSFATYYSSQRDTLLLTGSVAQSGSYTLTANVTYGGNAVSSPTPFSSIGDGVYQLKVTYFPRAEQANVPYVFGLEVSANGIMYPLTIDVYPS